MPCWGSIMRAKRIAVLLLQGAWIIRLDLIIQMRRMLHVNRSIVPTLSNEAAMPASPEMPLPPEQPGTLPGLPAEATLVEGILTELLGSIREIRHASMARPLPPGMSTVQLHVL